MRLFDLFKSKNIWRKAQSGDDELHALDLIAQGNLLEDAGQLTQALRLYDQVLRSSPNFARAHLNRGNVLMATGDVAGAIGSFETALLHDPIYYAAHYNLGNALVSAGQREAALAAYRQAIALCPDFVDAEVALGSVLDDLQQFFFAVAHYRRALTLRPGYAEVHANLGRSLRELGQFENAMASYRQSVKINPAYAEGHIGLGNVLRDLGQLQESKSCYKRALALDSTSVHARSNLLFLLNYEDNPLTLPEAQLYGAIVTMRARQFTQWTQQPDPARCLRIGFVSGDFRDHPVSYFFEEVIASLSLKSARRLELFGYSNYFHCDALTESIKAICSGWCLCANLSDETLAQRIHNDAIDILIDLSGHTAHNRLPVFAWKPAPVQATWLGYFGTTGVNEMDYLIADPWTLPAIDEPSFTERIWRLPETRLCFTTPHIEMAVSQLPAKINGYLTFGCFNNLTKVTKPVVALWARVLNAVPHSRLFLKSPQLSEPSVRLKVAEQFAVHGIGPEQLIFEGLSSRKDYLACYGRVDIALDPFPYPGGTTTVEALWMGVPVLTLQGDRFLSRQGLGLLMNAGLPDWIAADPVDYVRRATTHAHDLHALAMLRAALRQQVLASPLFNASDFARHFESALRRMWHVWCAQQASPMNLPASPPPSLL